MNVQRRPGGGKDGTLTDWTPDGKVALTVPRTLAEARAQVSDTMLEHRVARGAWCRGFQSALDLMGVDDTSAGIVNPHDPLLDAVAARRRDELTEARKYRSPARTAAQIASSVAYSHRTWERAVAERWQVAG